MTKDQLESFLGDLSAVQLALWIVAAVALFVLIVKAWPWIRRAVRTVDALAALPEKLKLLDEVHHEVRPNTGTSLNDAVRRTEAGLNELAPAVADLALQVQRLDARLDEVEDTIDPRKEP